MKKKVLAAMLVAAMTATMFAGCGNKGTNDASNDGTQGAGSGSAETQSEITDYGSGEIKMWVAENAVDFTKEKADEFLKSDDAYSGYTVTVEPVGEGDAAGNMITDVEGGADIYGFAQDQVSRLVAAGALQPVVGDYATWIADNNDEGSANAVKVGDLTYAFPMTSDNGYFLYYDKSVVTNPDSLDDILADCEKAGKNFYMEINSGWYQTAFFFATGCKYSYETDVDGNFTSCTMDYASDNGVIALKEMISLANSKAFKNGSSFGDATNVGAIVDGTWDAASIKKEMKDNYACAKLPSFKGADGKDYQLSGFSGYKMLGIKPQTDEGKLALCYKLAQFLTNADTQAARYEAIGWGPSNKEAQQSDAVQSDVALTALADQMQYDIPQGNYPGDYWTLATSLGDTVISKKGGLTTSADDDTLMSTLQKFQDTCIGYAK